MLFMIFSFIQRLKYLMFYCPYCIYENKSNNTQLYVLFKSKTIVSIIWHEQFWYDIVIFWYQAHLLPGNLQQVLPLVIGYPHGVLIHWCINQRPYANACLDASQFTVAPQTTSQSSFLLKKSTQLRISKDYTKFNF